MGRSSRCLAAAVLCALALGAAPAAASEWAPGDVEAASRYQRQERERAERYRAAARVAETAEAEVPRARAPGVTGPRGGSGVRRPAAEAPREAGGFVARLAGELRDAVLGSLRDALGAAAAALVAEFEPSARELARDLLGSARRALAHAWCEASSSASCTRA